MKLILSVMLASLCALPAFAKQDFERDVIRTTGGDLEIFFVGHASIMMAWAGKTIHVDPYSRLADYSGLPAADLLLITHEHPDHLDPAAVGQVRTKSTIVIAPEKAADTLPGAVVLKNGDSRTVLGIPIEAVPAYNLVHKRANNEPFHPKGRGNGYVLTFGATRLYIAGDTENTPEMKALRNIDIAFLPMNLPYTMTPEMVADAARAFRPMILYPYHTGDTDPGRIAGLLAGEKGIEVRIRKMK